jgi:MerR family mercuric resistance operon transcriptional regulator
MTIGIVARAAGVGVETVRFYERRGLIDQPPKPNTNGFRDYPPETVERIWFIRQAQDLGFSLREIDELLALQADPGTDCADVRARAAAKLQDVLAKIERLQRIRGALEGLIAACPGRGAVRVCSILDALTETRQSARKAARHQEVETGWKR